VEKLDVIFSNNKAALKRLRDLQKSATEAVTPGTTKPKGSAPFVNAILSALQGFGSLPGVKQFIAGPAEVAAGGFQARKLLLTDPKRQATVTYINREFPALAATLGLAVTVRGEENDN